VYADGALLYQSYGSPVHNGYNHPLLLPLNAAAHTPSPSSVLIRVDRLPSSGVGFSTVWVGDQASLAWRYQVRQLLQVQLPFMGSAAFLAVGAFAFGVWLGRRRESLYLLFFAISGLAFLRMLHYYVSGDYLPVSDEWFEWLTVSSLLWLIALIHLFLQRLHQQSSPWLTRLSLGMALVCSLGTLPQMSVSLYLLTPLLNLTVLPVAMLIFAVNLRKALRAQLPEGRLVAGWTVFAVAFTSYDGLLQNNLVSPESVYTSPYAIIGLFFVFSYIMFMRYTGAFAEVGRLNMGLAQRLQAREAELEQSYRRLRVIENQQMLGAERRRLMQDMHDGLGSTLISAAQSAHADLRLREAGARPRATSSASCACGRTPAARQRPAPAGNFFPASLLAALPAIEAELAGLARCSRCTPAPTAPSACWSPRRRPDRGKRAAAARRPVRLVAGGLRRRLPLLHDRPRRPAAPGGQRRDRRPGGAGAHAPAGEEGGVHGHGRAGPQPGQRAGGDRAARHRRQHRPQEPGVLHRGRSARVRAAAAGRVKPALALSLHTTKAELRATLLPRAPRMTPKSWSTRASATRAPPATRSSTSGRCWKASTTADELDGIVKLLRASTAC
jgi:hypothetical protein